MIGLTFIPSPVDIQTQATNVTILPDVLMQIAQLLAAQKITILPAPPPVPSGSINPLASSIEPLATSKPSTELLERIFDEDDGMSLKSLDNLVPTKTTERDLPLPSPQSTGPGEDITIPSKRCSTEKNQVFSAPQNIVC
ncbi:hypothetical protein MJO28_015689 [Puccinia striiformis f. sp. tritici]|uniref:Uncharacterized protein n=1 Tax=Puccinia striiformis f. sp. tritici TaxID=168172 RepID=A0ACC0DPE4_9BASI|nr:hypothetical protein MJO28_015689 [Puccinia striiformis f. sp. tritici]